MIFSTPRILLAAIPLLFSSAHASPLDITPRAPSTFAHPGVLVSGPQLSFVASRVAASAEPWSGAYKAMKSDSLASLTRKPSPVATVECGPTSTPNIGCSAERQDALAAYAMALAWVVEKKSEYASKAIEYFDAWSGVIKAHTNSNAPLQTGWSGAVWARAAEIIRYSDAGWSQASISKFETMLRNVYLPTVAKGSNSNGNWELVMLEAAIGISVFLEDKSAYDAAMTKFLGRVPAYVYLLSDGSYPKAAPGSGLDTKEKIIKYWQGQSTFQANGIAQETCRDLTHTGYGISSISHVAETARIQGTDLYSGDVGERLRYALGFHAQFEEGTAVPSWLCGGSLKDHLGPITEVGFNALHNRLGMAMTNTEKLTKDQRPAGTNYLFVGWETLTHAENSA
ncbi:putative secreted protein [Neofusicoccum parvum]|uniref:Secreted protein n=2 Tax=Neofusicoccum parvum TaxID=310453 RepID=A0ACB5SMY9_9PEZI|nr:putative secreted protein [Neofusicoccum parvum UCRNP2]GME48804.1 putative secreted protein [Neofusicoccum parvum]GME65475.1 putative secreted protein [Neofusicoccum parvum]